MFNLGNFIEDCKVSISNDQSHLGIKELVESAVSNPSDLIAALGPLEKAGATAIYHSDELTIVNVTWAPWMTVFPHNHNMWAVIGIYSGREDNVFWRRTDQPDGLIEAAGAKSLCVGDVTPLGKDIIHSVTNPIPKFSGAIHVYGGDFFNAPHRSEWDAEQLKERDYNSENVMNLFETFPTNS